MRKLSLNIVLLFVGLFVLGQENPHGDDFKLDCTSCHTTEGWKFVKTGEFDHNTTAFDLEGVHEVTDCAACHTSLVFSEAKTSCVDCHTDMHNTTVGMDCARCHDSKSWIVSNITEIHQLGRFPLLGAHSTADCASCHTSASRLEFEPLGTECIDCHRQDYMATTNPNHVQTGFSTNCIECHKMEAHEWSASGINHDFFPLTSGHAINECSACHTNNLTEPLSSDCYSCHQNDFLTASNPSHQNSAFSINCTNCHTTNPDWNPAEFKTHDNLFPIYSGNHRGEWDKCTDCHTQPENYSIFSCTNCHEHNQSETNDDHKGVSGYSYNSNSCYACHPSGDEKSAFNHNLTNFPLKGAHSATECAACHTSGYAGTSTDCNHCHTTNYNEASNPNHINAGISVDCATCHTENGWTPSSFDHTVTTGFELSGGHAGKQCVDCHQGTTSAASSDCFSCHQANYNEAKEHLAQGFPTNCLQCHTVNSWEASEFNHNNTNFPLTGSHVATECAACHTNGYAGTSTLCKDCHIDNFNQAQNPNHLAAGISNECATCHATSNWTPSSFDHTVTTGFELSGGHAGKQCVDCHQGTTSAASSDCFSCHQTNYNSAPNHLDQGFPTNCLQCHSVNSWEASEFNHNNTNFPLTGSHVATECAACHTNGYAGTSTLCKDCHIDNFNQAQNPNHLTAGISNECATCHATSNWTPSSFDHTVTTGFELSGGHAGKQCVDCHQGTTSAASSDCFSCHQTNYNSAPNHLDQGFPTNCLQCHTVNSWEASEFNHNNTNFPLTGSHVATECAACHTNVYAGTSTLCKDCHINNFNQAQNPNHLAAGISNECATCHATSNWTPSSFDHTVTTGFELSGGHAGKQCVDCHQGTTSAASSDCFSCHQANYNSAPNHLDQGFPTNCLQCHSVNSWEASEFNHNNTNFPLTGAHVATECAACHTNGYAGTSTLCKDCHIDNFNQAQNPNHLTAGISNECATCHATSNWTPSNFDHTVTTGFELSGGHAGKQCVDCHQGTTSAASSDCFSCHQANYNSAPNHLDQGFPTNCLQCHTVNSWEASEFDHNNTNFALTGAHVATECAACHTNGYAGTSTLCKDCHIDNFNQAQNPNHLVAGISNECATCHATSNWTPSNFDHTVTTGFELSGGHAGKQCVDCHQGTTSAASSDCFSCHQANYNSAPNHLDQGFPTNCLQCHTVNSWDASEFDHNNTNFPLTGAHVATECAACHTNGYAGTSTLCKDCHIDNFNQAQNPNHLAAGISNECETCHATSNWTPSSFDHTVTTGFELSGGHAGKQCVDCHQGTTSAASSDCFSCHQTNYNSAPNHLDQGFPTNCLQCHTVNSWEASEFNHNNTNFPLTGAHVATECAACHTNGYAGTSTLCKDCHIDNFNQAQNPNHLAAGISNECATCHATSNWTPSSFDHTVTTGFELSGGHAGKQCVDCHQGTTSAASSDCFSCHQTNYNSAPNHLDQGFPTNCLQCHSVNSWEASEFNHNNTNFPLTGSHVATECAACHTNGYAGTSTLCKDCHIDNFNQAQNPNHLAAGISNECETCHATSNWTPSSFDHTVTTGFELSGGHAGKQCVDCHQGTTSAASSDCFSCHQANYNEAKEHLAQGFPTNCLQCHTVNSWEASEFNHNNTNFALTGSHVATECAACHTNGYAGTSTLCKDCHINNFNQAQNPNHLAAGISNECATCHATSNWTPSSFDHTVTTGFELSGGHAGKQCVDCHQGTTSAASSDCFSCHQTNYNSAPNHLDQGFPTNCLQCHSVNSWEASEFNHNNTNFALTGAHVATDCASCHTNGYAGTTMLCSECHQTQYNTTANPNHSAIGISGQCNDCHTTNPGWTPATFPIHNSYYALNGAHARIANDCYLCHSGSYNNTANTCYACHTSDYNKTTNPNHATLQFSTDCLSCHTESAWTPATFDHDNQYFPIYSGKHRGEWNSCADCHTQASNYSVFSCIDCHEHNRSDMDSEHRGKSGYVYNSANCLACHPQGRE